MIGNSDAVLLSQTMKVQGVGNKKVGECMKWFYSARQGKAKRDNSDSKWQKCDTVAIRMVAVLRSKFESRW